MIKIQKSKPNRHKIYLLENCPSSINNREVLICNDYTLTTPNDGRQITFVDLQDDNPAEGYTALHLTVLNERLDRMALLLLHGASWNIADAGGRTVANMVDASSNEVLKTAFASPAHLDLEDVEDGLNLLVMD